MRSVRIAFCALTVLLLAHSVTPQVTEARGRGGLQLTPDAVAPGPGEAGASATATVNAGRDKICFKMTVGPLSGYIRTIAIYKAERGQVGPMVVRLSPSPIGINQLNGCIPVDSALSRDIGRYPGSYFIQINTDTYPGGAVRAQLGN